MHLSTMRFCLLLALACGGTLSADEPAQLPGTAALTIEGDVAAQLVAGVDAFLLKKLDESVAARAKHWQPDYSSREAFEKSIAPNRASLAKKLGLTGERVKFDAPELVATLGKSAVVAESLNFTASAVRWPVLTFPGPTWSDQVSIHGEGLLIEPKGREAVADVIVLVDADQTPEEFLFLDPSAADAAEKQFVLTLVSRGCRVILPTLISRERKKYSGANLTNREYAYRPGFELGQHLIGVEVQKTLACVDWFTREAGADEKARVGVVGYGEGGWIALYAAALDPRIDGVAIGGCFNSRLKGWEEPIDRNVFGLLEEFGGAELAGMVLPRFLHITHGKYPELQLAGDGGAPAKLTRPSPEAFSAELSRLPKQETFVAQFSTTSNDKSLVDDAACGALIDAIAPESARAQSFSDIQRVHVPDAPARQQRQLAELDRHFQWLLRESPYVRKARFWDKLDAASAEKYAASIAPFREEFKHEVIGHFEEEVVPANPRTRKIYDEEKWTGYEVMLDLWDGVFAYGIVCIPKNLPTDGSEKRPVVVCQHGLEGKPQDCIAGNHPAYHNFAAKLAEQGYITFCPQNLYIGKDNFRTLQRKSNPLGKTLFSVIVPQHQQIVDWLKTLPYVDSERIAFYGLSYGGKSAMRIPPLVPDYCLSICSADFNEWVDKNASTRSPYSYATKGEYEIFEWNLGGTFNYAEMAALIAPRPFMVERGHFDGVAADETVAHEFAKVRNLYQARLKLPPETCEIEFFVGPHAINGQGAFEFLKKHLKWEPK